MLLLSAGDGEGEDRETVGQRVAESPRLLGAILTVLLEIDTEGELAPTPEVRTQLLSRSLHLRAGKLAEEGRWHGVALCELLIARLLGLIGEGVGGERSRGGGG